MADAGDWPTNPRPDLQSCLQAALAALEKMALAETTAWAEAAHDLAEGHRLTEEVGVGWISAEDVDLHWDRRIAELVTAGIYRDAARHHLQRATTLFQNP